jgi:hypothetical protein
MVPSRVVSHEIDLVMVQEIFASVCSSTVTLLQVTRSGVLVVMIVSAPAMSVRQRRATVRAHAATSAALDLWQGVQPLFGVVLSYDGPLVALVRLETLLLNLFVRFRAADVVAFAKLFKAHGPLAFAARPLGV